MLARYPFLGDSAGYIKGLGVSLEALLADPAYDEVRTLGAERVKRALDEGAIPSRDLSREGVALRELLSYPVARMLVSCVPEPYLLRRYAIAEAVLGAARLALETDTFVAKVAAEYGVDLSQRGEEYRVHYTSFLLHTRSFRDRKWKLINRPVDEGLVILDREDFLRVLQNAVADHLMEQLPLDVNDAIVAALRPHVEFLKNQLAVRRERMRPEEVGQLVMTALPPCMQRLLAAVQASENVPHMGRFALVAFLHNVGVPNEEIYRIFSNVPDFAQDVTRYQIEHITGRISGTEYTAPECSTMKSYGICPGPDRLCETITHPLNYYRKKRWMERRRGVEGEPRPLAPAKAAS